MDLPILLSADNSEEFTNVHHVEVYFTSQPNDDEETAMKRIEDDVDHLFTDDTLESEQSKKKDFILDRCF